MCTHFRINTRKTNLSLGKKKNNKYDDWLFKNGKYTKAKKELN